MWLLPFRGRAFLARGRPRCWHNPDVAPILSASHSFPHGFLMCIEAHWANCLVPSSKEDRRGRGRGVESITAPFSFLLCMFFLGSHWNRILDMKRKKRKEKNRKEKKRSLRNCRIAVTVSCDRWGPQVRGQTPRIVSKQKPGLELESFRLLD